MEQPPPFQTAAQCLSCQSPFTTFKRRHHCRNCGRSFCNEHSANQKALPQYGLYTPVRVCDECFNPPKISASKTAEKKSYKDVDTLFGSLKLDSDKDRLSSGEESSRIPDDASVVCTCGMPLCICEAPSVIETVASVPVSTQPLTPQKSKKATSGLNSSPFKTSTLASSGNSMPSLFFSSGPSMLGTSHPLSKSYDLDGEGLREAVKNGDVSAVKDLLSQGVDPNYFDRQGMSLLHLATMFNFTEITFILMDSGASLDARNAQGETALDCAQPTLAHKIRRRIESHSKQSD